VFAQIGIRPFVWCAGSQYDSVPECDSRQFGKLLSLIPRNMLKLLQVPTLRKEAAGSCTLYFQYSFPPKCVSL